MRCVGRYRPVVRKVSVMDMRGRQVPRAFNLRGCPCDLIQGLAFTDCALSGVTLDNVIENVSRVRLRNVTVNGAPVRTFGP